jgi:hypothetical protein
MAVYIIAQLKFTRRELYDRYQSKAGADAIVLTVRGLR